MYYCERCFHGFIRQDLLDNHVELFALQPVRERKWRLRGCFFLKPPQVGTCSFHCVCWFWSDHCKSAYLSASTPFTTENRSTGGTSSLRLGLHGHFTTSKLSQCHQTLSRRRCSEPTSSSTPWQILINICSLSKDCAGVFPWPLIGMLKPTTATLIKTIQCCPSPTLFILTRIIFMGGRCRNHSRSVVLSGWRMWDTSRCKRGQMIAPPTQFPWYTQRLSTSSRTFQDHVWDNKHLLSSSWGGLALSPQKSGETSAQSPQQGEVYSPSPKFEVVPWFGDETLQDPWSPPVQAGAMVETVHWFEHANARSSEEWVWKRLF